MPNGGGDNCGTCCHNSNHPGKTGSFDDITEPCRCLLRSIDIRDPVVTYCVNHPFHDKARTGFAVGSVYGPGKSYYKREVILPSPDTEKIRSGLVDLVNRMKESIVKEAPGTPCYFYEEVIRQLGLFREKRAVRGLRRILRFRLFSPRSAHIHDDAASIAGEVLIALARILGGDSTPYIVPYLPGRKGARGESEPDYFRSPLADFAEQAMLLVSGGDAMEGSRNGEDQGS